MTTSLWKHQADEIPLMLAGHRLLAWEPGTGKTLGALTALRRLGGRGLIVVPAAVRYQWLEAAERLAFKTQLVESKRAVIDPEAEVVVVSYHMVIDPGIWKQLMKARWGALILDEAHYCKTPSTKWTKAIFGARKGSPACLMKRADRVWSLTGTPIMLDPSDLWVLVSRLHPSVLDAEGIQNREQWVQRWCVGRATPYGFQVTGVRDAERLHELLRPFMSRVRKRDVFKDRIEPLCDSFRLPPRKVVVSGEMSEAVQRLLAILAEDEADTGAADFALAELAEQPAVMALRRELGLSKAKEVADFVVSEIANGEKALVFYQHTDVGLQIFERLKEVGLDPAIYRGGMTPKKREAEKSRFVNDRNCRVFIAQLQAGGTGLDGLQIARRVIFAEEPWTPGAFEQAVSRVDRGGQTQRVYATSVVIAGSYDENVSRALMRRGRFVNKIINGERKAA